MGGGVTEYGDVGAGGMEGWRVEGARGTEGPGMEGAGGGAQGLLQGEAGGGVPAVTKHALQGKVTGKQGSVLKGPMVRGHSVGT